MKQWIVTSTSMVQEEATAEEAIARADQSSGWHTEAREVHPLERSSEYLTLTVVVRQAPDPDARALRHEVAVALDDPFHLLNDRDNIMFWSQEMGVTGHALEQGADPDLWHEED